MIAGLLAGLAVLVLGLPAEGRLRLAGLPPVADPRGEGALPIPRLTGSAPSPAAARREGALGAPAVALSTGGALSARGGWVALLALSAPLLVGLAVGLLAGPVPGALAAAAAVGVPRVLTSRRLEADRTRERTRAEEVCTTLAAELRAGRPLVAALTVAAAVAEGPSRELLTEAAAAAAVGGDVPAVLRRRSASAVPDLLVGLAACWQVCARSGSGLAAAVERLADGCREREGQRRAVEAALAGPRATAGLLAVLPLAGIGLAASLGAHPLHTLLRTPPGLLCFVLGAGLDGLGLWWTRRLVSAALR